MINRKKTVLIYAICLLGFIIYNYSKSDRSVHSMKLIELIKKREGILNAFAEIGQSHENSSKEAKQIDGKKIQSVQRYLCL